MWIPFFTITRDISHLSNFNLIRSIKYQLSYNYAVTCTQRRNYYLISINRVSENSQLSQENGERKYKKTCEKIGGGSSISKLSR